MNRTPWWILLVAALVVTLVAAPALAQDEEEDDLLIIEDEEEELDQDSLQIYRAFKEELKGLPLEEEMDAWYRYLDRYPETAYRREIERRVDELQTVLLDEAEAEAPSYVEVTDGGRGARYDEMPFVEPFTFLTNNTRSKVHLAISYGATQTFNYAFGVEHAFKRNFSVYGLANHSWQGIGFIANAGVKYAPVKETRTGGLFVVGMGLKGGSYQGPYFGIDPFIGLGVNPRDKPVTFQFQFGFDMRFAPAWHWDAHLGLNLGLRPSDKVVIFFETGGHNMIRKITTHIAEEVGGSCDDNSDYCSTEFFGFYEASAGVKVFPTENIEITVAMRAPYFYRKWQHYHPVGGGASVLIYY